MFGSSPLVSAGWLPFSGRRMFLSLLRRVGLVCWLPLVAHAGSLVSLQVTELAPAATTAATRTYADRIFSLEGQAVPLGTALNGQRLPGLDPTLTTVTAAEQDDALFVVALDPAGRGVLLRHTPKAGWERRAAPPSPLLAAAQSVSQAHVFFVSPDPAGKKLQLVAYHTITDTWAVLGTWPSTGAVQSVTASTNGFVVASREASGPVRLTQVELISSQRGLKVVDYAVILIYLCVVAGIGIYFYVTGKKDPANFFVAGRRIPWWAAGLSLYATGTSTIIYLAQNVITFVGSIYVAIVIVPLVRRLNLISVYQYLEMRFHPTVRMMASLICIVHNL